MSSSTRHLQLLALAEAWPFRAPLGFTRNVGALVYADRSDPSKPTGALAAELDRAAQALAPGQSLATIAALRDHQWFTPKDERVELSTALIRVARRHLRWNGDAVCLAAAEPDERHTQTMRWRWLSLELPQDLMIAALATDRGVTPCAGRVRLVGHALEQVLAEPVAETHLHVGAALEFGELWIALLEGATRADFGARIEAAPAPFTGREGYLRALVSAGLVRLLLAGYLWQRERQARDHGSFANFVHDRVPAIARRTGNRARAERVERALHTALVVLRTGLGARADSSLASLLRAHHLLWGPRRRPTTVADLLTADPLHAWLRPRRGQARPETTFISRALAHIGARGAPHDPTFARALWQYLRVRNLVFGHLVEAPGTAGLGWFTRHFDRLRRHRHQLGARVAESALRLESNGLNLRSLELRTAPEPRWFEVRNELRRIAAQAHDHSPELGQERPELAVVLHLIKKPEQVGRYVLRCRHGRWFHTASHQANAIVGALRHDPKLLLVLRGLDVAADELAVPNWVLRPLFARVHEAGRVAAARLSASHPRWRVPPLRATLHAGEEFHRLADGLRRIHETVEFGLIGEGDRLGHGLALGWSVERWCSRHPRSIQPFEERLFDLVWELERYRAGQLANEASRIALVEGQLDHLGRALFGERVHPGDLIDLRRALFDHAHLARAYNYPFGPRSCAASSDRLARYLVDPRLRRRARAPIEVLSTPSEAIFLARAQTWLRAQLSKLAITVETNPSSNLIIGDFEDFRAHPTFALSSPEPGRGNDQLPVSINSDDPLTFASCLVDEYAYVEAALVGRQTSANAALRWLDEARLAGWRSRFSLPTSSTLDALKQICGPRQRS